MKILFTHCWQTGNTGDVAIWKSMISHLKSAFPDITLTICSQRSEEWDINQLSEVTKTTVVPLLSPEALKEADVVINQGGGYMNGQSMKNHFAYMQAAQLSGKPTFFGSQTFIGKLDEGTKELGRNIFNNANLVIAREEESYKFITEYVGAEGPQIKLLPDGVFTVKAKTYANPIPQNAVKIGIRGYLATMEFLKEIAKFADMAAEALGPIVFIPVGNGERNDVEQARKIAEMMNHESIVIDSKPDAGEIIDIVKDGILISDRYHGIVYSASACTPFVPLTPDIGHKMPGLLKMIDYPLKRILQTRTTTAKEIFEYAVDVWKSKEEIRNGLERTIPKIKRQAELVYKYIIEEIKKE